MLYLCTLNSPVPTTSYTLSLHDALPISARPRLAGVARRDGRRPKTKRSARARCRNRQPRSFTLAQASCKTLRKRLARAERVLVGKSVWAITYTLLPLGIAVAYSRGFLNPPIIRT